MSPASNELCGVSPAAAFHKLSGRLASSVPDHRTPQLGHELDGSRTVLQTQTRRSHSQLLDRFGGSFACLPEGASELTRTERAARLGNRHGSSISSQATSGLMSAASN